MAFRALIVDDDPTFTAAARELLEHEGVDVVGTASSAVEATQQTKRLRPDVVLVDIELGQESGFDLAKRLAAATDLPRPHVIIISTYAGEDFADLIAASPVLGFVPKSRVSAAAISELLERGGFAA